MAFEDLQKAFVEVELEKLKEKGVKVKLSGVKKLKGKKKVDGKKKPGLAKVPAKLKEKAELEKLEKEKAEAKKLAKENEAKKDGKKNEKEREPSSSPPYEAPVDPKIDLTIYQQKFYLPEDHNRVSGVDQLGVINKLPQPEKDESAQEKKQPELNDKHQASEDRAKQIRKALDHGAIEASLTPAKTPLAAEIKANKKAAEKDSGASMNTILALHSDRGSK